MSDRFKHTIKSALENQTEDVAGIEWNDFEHFRSAKKKRRGILLGSAVLAVLTIGCGIGYFLLNSFDKAESIGYKKSTPKGAPINGEIRKLHEEKSPSQSAVSHHPYTSNNVIKSRQKIQNNNVFTATEQETNILKEMVRGVKASNPVGASAGTYSKIKYAPQLYSLPLRISPIQSLELQHRVKNDLDVLTKESNIFKSGWNAQFKVGMGTDNPVLKITDLGRNYIHKNYASIRNQSEKGLYSWSAQFSLGKTYKRWMFGAGLGYSSYAIQGKYDFEYSEIPVIDVDGKIISYAASQPVRVQFNSIQKINVIEIPFSLQYRLSENRNSNIAFQLGGIPQFLNGIGGQLPNTLLLDQKEALQNSNFKSFSLTAELGLPMYYRVGNKSGVSIIPYFRHNFGLGQVQSYYYSKFNTWGIQCGYWLKF